MVVLSSARVVGLVVDKLEVRPSQSKIDAVPRLTRANTVEEARALLGTTGYLRKFVPRYSGRGARQSAGGANPCSDVTTDFGYARLGQAVPAPHRCQRVMSRSSYHPDTPRFRTCFGVC